MAEPRLILASASPRRSELLAALGVPFEVAATNVDEDALVARHAGTPPVELATLLARAKTEALDAPSAATVLAADTIVVLQGRPLGKPRDAAEATAMLRALRGREHEVATGIAVRCAGEMRTDVAVARVVMRWYGDGEIERYVATGGPFDKAGAYAIQDPEFAPVVWLRGCRCAVIGLPLWQTARLIAECGLHPQDPALPVCGACPHARKRA